MSNLFDYMKWRDIDMAKVELNEIDALILSRLSYFPLDDIFEMNEEITVKECYQRYEQIGNASKILQKEDSDLFQY